MSIFTRNAAEPEPEGPVWPLGQMVGDKIEDAELANPDLTLRVRPDVPTTTEVIAAKKAARPVDTVMVGCGTCTVEVPRSEWADHKCNVSPRQEARNRRAMEQMARAATFPTITTTCDMCGTEWSGGVHRCTAAKDLTPADAAALAFQQAGARQALQEMIDLAKGTDGTPA